MPRLIDALEQVFVANNSQSGPSAFIEYSGLSGSFTIGEVITGATSGATAAVSASLTAQLTAINVSGNFQLGETITGGTSGATATIDNYFLYNFPEAASPLVNGQIDFFESGSSSVRKTTYADSGETIPNPNPLILNGDGRVPNVFGSGTYRIVVRTSTGIQILQRDPIGGDQALSFGADWNSERVYSQNDVVRDNDQYWISQTNNNLGNQPFTDSGANWQLIILDKNTLFSITSVASYADMDAMEALPTGAAITLTGEGIAGEWVVDDGAHTANVGTIRNWDNAAGNQYLRRLYSGAVNIKWFGAAGDGVADDTTAIQSAIDELGVIFFPGGIYRTTAALTVPAEVELVGVGRRGGAGTSIILAEHTGTAVLSITGFTHAKASGLYLKTDDTTYPKTGLLLGRTSAASAGHHNFEYLKIEGKFSVAPIYSIASEVNTWSDIYVLNKAGTTAKYCFYTSTADDLSVASLTSSTNLACTFTSAYFINESTDQDAACIYMESDQSMGSWNWYNAYLIPFAGSYVHINNETDAQALGPYAFYGLNGERLSGGDPMYGVRITNNVALSNFVLNGLTIVGNRFDLLAVNTTAGSDDTSTAAAFMTNTAAAYTANEFVGMIIENETDESYALITANTATTITGTLRGGTNNNWDSGDTYTIYDKYSMFIDSNITLTQSNVVMQSAEAFPYAINQYRRNNMKGGLFSVGRDSDWITPTLLNGWANTLPDPATQVGISLDASGNVQLRGLISSGTGTILIIPKRMRPYRNLYITTSGNGAYARLLITAATGAITVQAGAGPQIDLNPISYRTGI